MGDPFDDVLNLEDQFYEQGYKQGTEDGTQAGKIEGRAFGLEKGFEKFLEAGKLYGKAIVWANRLPEKSATSAPAQNDSCHSASDHDRAQGDGIIGGRAENPSRLSMLPKNTRLERNITALHALVESESISTANTDEAVNDFDDRLRRAQGKAKIIEKAVGEDVAKEVAPARSPSNGGEASSAPPIGQLAAARDGW